MDAPPDPASTPGHPRPSDTARQVAVVTAVVFMIVAAMVGVGLFGGTGVRDLQGGALDADATVLAPGRPAFSIWSVIYLLTIGYAVWQALPGQRSGVRQRTAGWWIALTAVLNGFWLIAAQFTSLVATVLVIALLLVVLSATLRVLATVAPVSWADRVLMDGAVGLHLGWVALATVANVAAWLAADVVPAMDVAAQAAWGILVLAVVALIGIGLAAGLRRADAVTRVAPALAMAWGLAWIGIARLTGEPSSTPVGVAALIAAAIVVCAAVAMPRGAPRA